MDLFYWFLIAAFVLFIVEIVTPGMFAFFSMAVASLVTACFTFIIKDINILMMIDAVLSIVVFVLMKNMKIFRAPTVTTTNADRYIGKTVKIVAEIEEKKYRVKIYSEEWTGISEDILAVGDECEIVSIDGITMKIKKISKN